MLNLFLLKLKSMTSSWLTQPFNLTVLTHCLFWGYDLSLGKLFFPLSSCKKWNKPQMGTSAQGYLGVCKKKKKDKNSVKVMKTSKTSLICMRGLRCIKDAKIPEKCLFFSHFPLVKPQAFLRVRGCKSRYELLGVNERIVGQLTNQVTGHALK